MWLFLYPKGYGFNLLQLFLIIEADTEVEIMVRITKITSQKKNENRLNIFIDEGTGEKYGFSLDMDVFAKYQLRKGMELDKQTLNELLYEEEVKKGYQLALNYLSYRMRSEKEIAGYLIGKEVHRTVIDIILERLKRHNYINDQEFSIAFVRTQARTTDKGPMLIRRALQEKGVTEGDLEAGLAEYSYEDQLETAEKIAHKKQKQYRKESAVQAVQKIKQALMQKGFPSNIVNEAVAKLTDKSETAELEALHHQAEKAARKYRKYTGSEFEMKVKQALYRKGFPLDSIQHWLDQNRLNDS